MAFLFLSPIAPLVRLGCPGARVGNTGCWWRVGAAVWLVQPCGMLGDAALLPDPAVLLSGLLAAVPHSAWTVLSWAPKEREGSPKVFGWVKPGCSQGSVCHHLCLPAGVRMGSLGLFLQCITSIFFSTIMDRMVKQFGTRAVYLASVVFFPVAAFVMCLSHSVIVVTISAALTGFTFSALQILPYTLASLYHHEKQVGTCSRGLRAR